jgi:hypothetical protein
MLSDILGVEKFTFLHIKNSELQSFKKTPEIYSDETVKNSFDNFYKEVCSWRTSFPRSELMDLFWGIGVGYDGYKPGMNESFLGLYEELMTIATSPLSWQEGDYEYEDVFPKEDIMDRMSVMLEDFDNGAKDGDLYFAVAVHIEGQPEPEIIVNTIESLDAKLVYWIKTYDGDLKHKQLGDKIKIVGWASRGTWAEIGNTLL